MLKHILLWLIKSVTVFLIHIPLIVLGPLVVALALPFRSEHGNTVPFTKYPGQGEWRLIRLPAWARWWDNPYDGMWGDKRGWWDNECRKSGRTCKSFLSMWLWAAIRNPTNYFSRNVVGVDVSKCSFVKLGGRDVVEADKGFPGWQFLMAVTTEGRRVYRFFAEIPYTWRGDKLFLIDIGWKIKLSHKGTLPTAEPQDRMKGSVFTISPWKSL